MAMRIRAKQPSQYHMLSGAAKFTIAEPEGRRYLLSPNTVSLSENDEALFWGFWSEWCSAVRIGLRL